MSGSIKSEVTISIGGGWRKWETMVEVSKKKKKTILFFLSNFEFNFNEDLTSIGVEVGSELFFIESGNFSLADILQNCETNGDM